MRRARHHGLPFAAGHEQMEQDRASSLRLDQPELARQAARELRGDPAIDRRDHDRGRTHGAVSTRHHELSRWTQDIG